MIVFNKLWAKMKREGITTYQLRNTHAIDSKTIQRLKKNDNVTTKTLNKLCSILKCSLNDITEYIPDEESNPAEKQDYARNVQTAGGTHQYAVSASLCCPKLYWLDCSTKTTLLMWNPTSI